MKFLKNPFRGFTPFEWSLWLLSLAGILLSYFLCGNTQFLYLIASLLGATALIFVSKGHVLGQILTVVFSALYGYISWTFRYYGEMITYLGMTAPIAVAAVISWMRHPFRAETRRTEVTVRRLRGREYAVICLLGLAITFAFYFILRALRTQNLVISTVSVFTSFLAVVLTARRSALYALAYAANDVVLILLWSLASATDREYLSMVVCFAAFFLNDVYGFFQWQRMRRRQEAAAAAADGDADAP